MRLWSIDFKYLDSRGIVALWREALLAKKVLEGKTKGYKNHPQLNRFKASDSTHKLINTYLYYVYLESKQRGYNFDESKINHEFVDTSVKISVTNKQIEYEFIHLLNKLKDRDNTRYENIKNIKDISSCQLFNIISGEIEKWEIT